jgi:4-hydroxy-tetrahydrodipicolinate reductase
MQALCKAAAQILGDSFDVEIIEKHHNLKKDAPSGTALMLADTVNEAFDNGKRYVNGRDGIVGAREKSEIGIHAVRGGTIVGEHEVLFAGEDEIITISHSARSKRVFAVGAIRASKFICGKPAGKYDMKDLLAE